MPCRSQTVCCIDRGAGSYNDEKFSGHYGKPKTNLTRPKDHKLLNNIKLDFLQFHSMWKVTKLLNGHGMFLWQTLINHMSNLVWTTTWFQFMAYSSRYLRRKQQLLPVIMTVHLKPMHAGKVINCGIARSTWKLPYTTCLPCIAVDALNN